MTKIQVIFLFTKIANLTEQQKNSIRIIVAEEYCKQFYCDKSSVQVELYDGTSKESEKYDIVLSIDSEHKMINEGTRRNNMCFSLATKLWILIPKSLNFNGRILTRDGQVTETVPKNNVKTSSEDVEDTEQDILARMKNYVADDPKISLNMLQIPDETRKAIDQSLNRIKLEPEVFEEWGLYAIMPNPVCALSFYGTPGSGKTMAADAIADSLGKKIIRANYADIESKYHGEGPKNVNAIFKAAEEQDAVLFIDEADALLSKRLTNVTQGSEQAINSMRAQILICLERFHGIVIFATNLVINYDKAFVSRLISIEFPFPDAEIREKIWRAHLLPIEGTKVKLKIPIAEDIDFSGLAKNFEICGRVIRNVVINACVAARSRGESTLSNDHLLMALQDEIKRAEELLKSKDYTANDDNRTGIKNISDEGKQLLERIMKKKMAETSKKQSS